MKQTLQTLKSIYDIDKKAAASMIAMLASLEPGEEFNSHLGRITKLENDTFKIGISKNNITKIIEELTDDKGIQSIFDN